MRKFGENTIIPFFFFFCKSSKTHVNIKKKKNVIKPAEEILVPQIFISFKETIQSYILNETPFHGPSKSPSEFNRSEILIIISQAILTPS